MAQITVLFFSYAADRMNGRQHTYEILDGISVQEFFNTHLQAKLGDAKGFMFSVNAEWAKTSHPLRDGDQLAVIPPVSGG